MPQPDWLGPESLRIGLGCMRLWPADRAATAEEAVAAALDAGITVFDTARAYDGPDAEPGANERHLADLLRRCGASRVRIVTKGGMRRLGTAWIPDGRARAIHDDCEASLAALGGMPIDLYLLHAPDPRTTWTTSVRALSRLIDEGLVRRIGLSNVNRGKLDEALDIAPITAVEIPLSPFDTRALRDGFVAACEDRGVTVIAHSPLGGPRRAARLRRHPLLLEIARVHAVDPAQVALAWLLDVSPSVVAIPGARRAETVRSAAAATALRLTGGERAALRRAFGEPKTARITKRHREEAGDVVVVMGIPGAGKSRIADELVQRGYVRLNRDERGGSLRQLADALDRALAAGARHVVLDNTWLTRAARSDVVEIAARHGVAARCIWLETPLAQAQVNMVQRLIERYGALPTPDQLRMDSRVAGVLTPTSQMRTLRELEPPAADEGFLSVERRTFSREPATSTSITGVVIAASAVGSAQSVLDPTKAAACLVFDWRPDSDANAIAPEVRRLEQLVHGVVDGAVCPHPGGPPVCWCRPPLPGLVLDFARRRNVDLSRSALVGSSAAHRTLAGSLGLRFIAF